MKTLSKTFQISLSCIELDLSYQSRSIELQCPVECPRRREVDNYGLAVCPYFDGGLVFKFSWSAQGKGTPRRLELDEHLSCTLFPLD